MANIVIMPKLGFDMAEGTLVRWVKAEGEKVEKSDVLAEIETDKATVEVESSFTGVLLRQLVEQGAVVPVSTPIAMIGQPGEAVPDLPGSAPEAKAEENAAPAPEKPAAIPAGGSAAGPIKASPLAKRIAATKGLDLQAVQGSGPGGRIVKRDVEAALTGVNQPAGGATPTPAAQATAAAAPANVTPAAPVWQPGAPAPSDQHIPVEKLRAIIGRRMSESKQSVPHFYVTHEFDMDALMSLRKQINELLPDEQKISVNDFIVKGIALALRQFPGINASLAGNEIIRHGQINVGVAVAMDAGLMTVVVRDADQKPLRVISAEVREMVARARAGKVRPEDIEGSTFSISNLGMFDVEHFIAIINPPEAAILAVGSAKPVPVVRDGQVVVGTRMKATLSADHRVTDGAEAARFLQALALNLEQPMRLLI
ncbi:pyruvate/2-oxoglutarate dehydrogenase complex, dihydrolipoamide acyltransferase (E2) component [Longilinea arvoryzae]|uniref:Dihydrolipoamide acetyltransferase component of pyruvate dehydrogenase complex n=1 Tax=Longilinea arvoryzae TaxID=360412 RepID=A0A0S7BGP5_9CHLR|nr:dihydrolipoamide acetyltransferase family protein [Longilinea arvoryzae]GAP14212.1 pyruvate/2-oxoglutarate dehydrogenase complex, dihydrolipoamide acyltransferase (E2) component [Longilinea arvoryzae]